MTMISMNNLVCTKYPPTIDPPLPQTWRSRSQMYNSDQPRMTDREMYNHLRSSFARLPPPDACVNETTAPTRCGTAIEGVRRRVDTMMRAKPLVNCKHYPGSRETVDAQQAHLPEMAMGAFNIPCPHLRSQTSFDLTRNSPTDKALRERIRRCKIPPVTAICNRQPDGLIVCTFRSNKPPAYFYQA